jgi:hypothetical protein
MDDPARAPLRPPEVPSQYRHERIHDPPVPVAPVQETAPPHPAAPRRGGILDWLSLTVWDAVTGLIAWSRLTGRAARPTPSPTSAEPSVSRVRRSYGLGRLRRAHVVVGLLAILVFAGGWVIREAWDALNRPLTEYLFPILMWSFVAWAGLSALGMVLDWLSAPWRLKQAVLLLAGMAGLLWIGPVVVWVMLRTLAAVPFAMR